MTRKPENESDTSGIATSSRRPYNAPHLRRLGSVRELTLGKSGSTTEGPGTFVKNQGKGKG
jgi:hypothetical protein